MKRFAIVAALLLAALAAGAGYCAWYAQKFLEEPLVIAEEGKLFTVRPGSSLIGVANQLAQNGHLRDPWLLGLYARWRGDAARIQAGEYRLLAGTTPPMLMEQLVSGRVVMHTVTLVEGWTFRQFRSALAVTPTLQQTLGDASDEEVMKRLGQDGQHPEGRFFPDTYPHRRGTTDLEVLSWAYEAMADALARVWSDRSPDLPFATPEDALILASIIEKETGLASERPQIAGVFVRRLQRGMRLQTDPTVIYGLGEAFDGDLRRRDLRSDTPYNTYTRSGLPPTPIAMPGLAALQAAVHPADGNSLYFVATGKGDGSHYFSATLVEHNAAVARYLARLSGGGR